MDDELELEVSDLRTGRPVETPLVRERRGAEDGKGSAGRGTAAVAAAELPVVEAPIVERMRPAGVRAVPRALLSRRAQGVLVAGVVLLACTGILVTLPGAQQSIRRALAGPTPTPTPTPTATLPPDESTVYLVNAVPWGTLTVDGHTPSETDGTLTRLNYGGSMVLHLGRGRHTLAYTAQPFPSVKCALSVPAASGDTCPPATNYSLTRDPGNSRVIYLGASLDGLPSDQLPSLDGAVAAGSARAPTRRRWTPATTT